MGIPTSGVLFDYRGHRYEEHSQDRDNPYERRLLLEPGWRREDFPEASSFSDDPDDPWVSIGAGAIDAAWVREVHGIWHGCAVRVAVSGRGPGSAEQVLVTYAGSDPAEAHRAGFISNPYQYWWATVGVDEVEITSVALSQRDWV